MRSYRTLSAGHEDDATKKQGGPPTPSKEGDTCTTTMGRVLLIALYLSLNISLNMINKWTLSGFGFGYPITLSIAHQVFTLVALAPMMMTRHAWHDHVATIQKQWLGLLGISVFFSFNLGCNNVSLLSISLSLNQVIRACIPVATALGATIIESKPPTRQELLALLVLVTGVGIAIWDGATTRATVHGIILCVLGTLSNGFMMSSIGKLLTEKLDVWRLTWYCSPMTVLLLLPFFWRMESAALAQYRNTSTTQYLVLIGLGCANALAYNVVHSLVIKVTSSVTTTVLGEAKIIFLLVLSSVWLGESDIWSAKMLLGVTVAMLGFAGYGHAKLAAGAGAYASLPIIKGVPALPASLQDSARSSVMSQKLVSGEPR